MDYQVREYPIEVVVQKHLKGRENGTNELYDLKNDPGEEKNLYNNAAAAKMRDQLQEKLTAWQKSIDDPILTNPLNTRGVGGTLDVR